MHKNKKNLTVCQGMTCGRPTAGRRPNPAAAPHSCPYQEDINSNPDPEYCTCCNDCRSACVAEI